VSKIVIGSVGRKSIGFDTDLLLAGRLLATADSGGGKSWLVRVLLEQTFGKVQTITIDPEGEFASLREKFPFVLAGKGGETPTDLRSAGMLAHRLLKLRVSAICDLYEMKSDLRHLWVKAFLDALVEAPKELRTPVIVVIDEAHMFCPEKGQGESEAKQSVIDVCTRGRKRGICPALVTQRLAMLDKNATSQLQNRLIGPTFEEVNIATAIKLLGIAEAKEKAAFHREIQLLEPGNFFALGRAISRERILIQVRGVETTHPKAFEKHTAPLPPTPEKIKNLLPQLADLPAEAEKKAQTEAEYKREIRELKHKLSAAEKTKPAQVQVSKADPTQARAIQQLRAALEDVMRVLAKITMKGFEGDAVKTEDIEAALKKAAVEIGRLAASKITAQQKEFDALKKDLDRVMRRAKALLEGDNTVTVGVSVVKNEPVSIHSVGQRTPTPTREPRTIVALDGLTAPQSRILKSLAEFAAIGIARVARNWVAARSGASATSSSFSNNLGTLRSGGLIDYENGKILLTTTGKEKAGVIEAPLTPEEMADSCKSLLTLPQIAIFDALYRAYPRSMAREEIATATGASVTSSSFSNNLGMMRSAGMIDYGPDRTVFMQKWVFLENAEEATA
jgi:hypothetical protein